MKESPRQGCSARVPVDSSARTADNPVVADIDRIGSAVDLADIPEVVDIDLEVADIAADSSAVDYIELVEVVDIVAEVLRFHH